MTRVACFGVVAGLAWHTPHASLAAIAVALGLDEDPRAWAAGALIAAAVAIATEPWLAVPRPAEERVILGVVCGLALSALRAGPAWPAVLLASGLGALVLDRWIPAGWQPGVGGIAAGLGALIPGLPYRPADAVAWVLALSAVAAAGAAWKRYGPPPRGVLAGLAVGSALASHPFQAASPPRIDVATPTEIASSNPAFWPRDPSWPDAWGAAGGALALGLGLAMGVGRRGAA